MARKSDIRLRRSAVSGSVPGGADLNLGELALNTADGAIFVKNGGGDIVTVSHDGILHYDEANSRIGIGTTNPSSTFQVEGTSDYLANFKSSDAASGIKLTNSSSQSRVVNISGHLVLVADANNNNSNSTIRFNIDTASVAASASSMILTSTGLGIGISSPGAKLQVDGAIVSEGGSFTSGQETFTDAGLIIQKNHFIYSDDDSYLRKIIGHTASNHIQIGQQNTALVGDIILYPGSTGNVRVFASGIEDVRINDSGNMGVGNTSPVARLDVAGDAAGPTVFDYGYATDAGIRVYGNEAAIDIVGNDDGNHASSLLLRNSNDGFALINSASSDRLEFKSFTATGDGFSTHSTGSAVSGLTDILTLQKTGNVGIGTTNPAQKLHVAGTVEVNGNIYFDGSTTSTHTISHGTSTQQPAVTLWGEDHASYPGQVHIIGRSDNAAAHAGEISFWDYTGSGWNRNMVIKKDGKVGIGTDNPSTKLEVAGDLTLPSDGQIKFKGTNHYPRIYAASNDLKINLDNGSGSNFEAFRIENTTGAITFNNAFTFPTAIGTAGQILKVPTSGTVLEWTNDDGGSSALVLSDTDSDTKIQVEESTDEDIIRFDVAGSEVAQMTDDGVVLNDGYNFEGDVIGAIKFKAQAGEALTKGDTVYISGISGNTTIVSKADANDAAKMPAFGLAASTVSLNAAVQIVTFGTLQGIDTSSYSEGDELYVNVLAGTLTDSAPTGSSSAVQKIAKVTRSDASAGSVKVSGAGRTNATPNLDEGKIFVGNSSNQSVQGDDTLHVDMANSRVGINKAAPLDALHVTGVIRTQLDGNNNKHIRLFGGNSGNFLDSYGNTLYIRPSGNTATATTMDASGNVGIGADLTVAGDLTVNGTQTILNTATLSVDDLNITVADGAADAAAANGAGLTVDGANATWTYSSADDAWASNKHAQFYTLGGTGTLSVGRTSNQAIRLYADDNYNRIFAYQDSDTNGDHFFDLVRSFEGTGKADMRFMNGTAVHAVLDKDGNFGINTAAPSNKLEVNGIGCMVSGLRLGSSASGEGLIRHGGATSNGVGITTGALTSPNIKLFVAHANDGGGVGIGTTTPDSKLHIHQTGSGTLNTIITEDDARKLFIGRDAINCKDLNNNSALLYLNQAGGNVNIANRLGIGTTSPLRELQVKGTGNTAIAITSPNTNYVQLALGDTDDDNYAQLILDNATNKLQLQNGGGGVVGNRGITLDSSENVGIGTSSPAFKLDVQVANGNTLARFKDSDSSHPGIIIAGDTNAGWVGNNVGVTGEGIYYQSSDNLMRFYINSSEKMRADSSGRLLVNATTTAFSDKLYINGDGYATGGWRTGTGATFVGELTNSSGKLALQSDASRDIQLGDTNNPDIVYIDTSAQNVGIGTNSPGYKLDLGGTTANTANTIRLHQNNGGTALRIGAGGGSSDVVLWRIDGDSSGSPANHAGATNLGAYGYSLKYFGTGSGQENRLKLLADNGGNSSQNVVYNVGQNGDINFEQKVGIGVTDPKAKFQVEEYGIDTTATSTTATTQVAIHSFPIANFRSARFTIQITNTTDSTYHSTEILAIHDGTTANITEFGEVHTGSSVEATFDADVNNGNFRLLATPASTNNMTFKVVCHSLTV